MKASSARFDRHIKGMVVRPVGPRMALLGKPRSNRGKAPGRIRQRFVKMHALTF